jgi:hypothetical protein
MALPDLRIVLFPLLPAMVVLMVATLILVPVSVRTPVIYAMILFNARQVKMEFLFVAMLPLHISGVALSALKTKAIFFELVWLVGLTHRFYTPFILIGLV